jgi:short-subunit dehydrogenase
MQVKKTLLNRAICSGAFFAAAASILWFKRMRIGPFFHRRVAVISGGSRGLGLLLAREFARKGAILVLLARDAHELQRAERILSRQNASVKSIACDLTDPKQIQRAVDAILKEFGRIDVLVNNAGIIQVGPYRHMGASDYHSAMAVHFWASYHLVNAVVPYMRLRKWGRIVNISSLGGRIAVPHLLPYTCSKFALTGFSDGLCSELAREGIRVTTVIPGLMRTGSHVRAVFKGRRTSEFAWFSFGASLPGVSVNARRAARSIVRACKRGSPTLIIGISARIAIAAQALLPESFSRIMQFVNAFLPGETAEENENITGSKSRDPKISPVITWLADKEIEKNNEAEK